MSGINQPSQQPYTYAWPYNPAGNTGFDPNGVGGALAPMVTQFLQQWAGPTNFLPHQNPAQAMMDQMAMKQYFSSTQMNTYAAARAGTPQVGNVLAGAMGLFTNQPLTDLNRQQANFGASILNNPHIKPMIAAAVGPERLEEFMFGTKGDPAALAGAANRIGYYRPDPATGASRIKGQSLADFTADVYSTLYEPAGNMEEMVTTAQKRGDDGKAARERLKKAARAEHEEVVIDEDVAGRIERDVGAEEVGRLYKKYRAGGEATSVADQARELARIDGAVKETGVLAFNESSVSSLQQRAERAAVENMHGFSASKSGAVMEHLFQRGMLPQSIGALTPAERVRAIASNGPLDEETTRRLATQFARQDLAANDRDYQNATPERREEIVTARLGDYEKRIGATMKKIKDRSDDASPIKPDEARGLLELDGVGQIASNVDAGRAGQTVKKHTEALAAIREIFGDNGNPNAPVPALLAALDHLGQGAGSRSANTSKVASTLRQMRMMAKDMGMGFEQMAGMAAGVNAYGSQLGLSDEQKLNATANAMAVVNNMNQRGAFANRGFGTMSKEEATQYAAEVATRTEGSMVAKGAAAFRRAYAENKDKYEGTELGTIAKKMEDPNWDGSYEAEVDGKKVTRNFWQEMGRDANAAINRIGQASGADHSHIRTLMTDWMTQEYATSGSGLKAARADMTEMIKRGGVESRLGLGVKRATGSLLADGTERSREGFKAVSQRLTEVLLDTAGKSGPEQIQHLEDNLASEFAKTLETQGFTATEAKEEAQRVIESTFGKTKEERADKFSGLVSGANMSLYNMTQGRIKGLRGAEQILKGFDNLSQTQADYMQQADRAHQLGLGYQGTSIERLSDALSRASLSGQTANLGDLVTSTMGITPEADLVRKMAPELQGEFADAQRQIQGALVTENYLNDLRSGRAVDYEGNAIKDPAEIEKQRKKLASRGMSDTQLREFGENFVTKVADSDLAERRQTKLAGMVKDAEGKKFEDTELYKTYQSATGGKGRAKTADAAAAELSAVHLRGGQVTGFTDADFLQKGEYSEAQLRRLEAQQLGNVRTDSADENAWANERAAGEARVVGLFNGSETELLSGLRNSLIRGRALGKHGLTDEQIGSFMAAGAVDPNDKSATAETSRKEFEALMASLPAEAAADVRARFETYNEDVRNIDLIKYASPQAGMPGPPRPGTAAHQITPAAAAGTTAALPGPGAPVPATAPHPGSDAAAAAAAAGTGDPAQAAAAANMQASGPLGTERAADAAAAAQAAQGPGAPAPGRPSTPDVNPQQQGAPPAASGPVPGSPTQAPTHPGSSAASADVTAGAGSAAQATAASNMQSSGPLGSERAAQAAAADQAAKGPGAAAPRRPFDMTPEESAAHDAAQGQRANETLTAEISGLTKAIQGLDKPFKDLIDAMNNKGGKGPAQVAGSEKTDRHQLARENRTNLQNIMFHQKGSQAAGGGGGGGGGGTIKGTLTLVGLQSAILSAKGSPVFTPTGEGPSVVPGNAFAGAYISSAAVSPIAEA